MEPKLNKDGKFKRDMNKKKAKISIMVNKIETENEHYIARHKHVLKGYIENKDNIDEENINFLNDSEGKLSKKDEFDFEIDVEKLSFVNETKNMLIQFFNIIIPFKGDIKFIKANYNTTTVLVFRIYRYLFLMSIFTSIIYLPLFIIHIIKDNKNLGKSCKYGFPCFLFYSSFNQSEALNMSVTYGVWLILYFICTMIYFFLLNSENNQQETYFQNNKNYAGGSYLFGSWNFNYKEEKITDKNKEEIRKELGNYTEDYIEQLDGKKEKKCSLLFFFLTNIVFLAFLVVVFLLILIFFYLREKMRNNNKIVTNLGAVDILADIVTYLLIGAFIYMVVWLAGFFPKFENWPKEKQKHISEGIKKIITTGISIISMLFIISYFTLYSNKSKKLIPFLDVENISFFGCPGKYENHKYDIKKQSIINTHNIITKKYYSQCREEDVGITFLFIFIVYFILLFLGEFLKSLLNSFLLCMETPTFRPAIYIINFINANMLYLIVIYFIPFLAIFYPFIVFILYKFHFFILKKKNSYSFKEMGISKRNNNSLVLSSFIIYNLAVFCIIGFLYFAPIPHSYTAECYTPKEVTDESFNILIYNTENWCGPLKSKVKLSSILTKKMEDILFIRWIVGLFQQLPFIIVSIAVVLVILIYRKYYPDKSYYEYIVKKQKDLLNSFYVLYDQISKRDILTSMLLKITQQKMKSK